tara:strand:- start:44413 stop:45669 length:1257 start_codon:yes stop_codon:yes gene_type:complete
MASRTRVISQSKAVYASPTGILASNTAFGGSALAATESGFIPHQLHRVDNFSFDVDLAGARQDVREFGQLARIGTVTMSELNPTFSLGYFLGNGENEATLGFNTVGFDPNAEPKVKSQFISGVMTEDEQKREKNLYVLTVKEGEDAFKASAFTDAERTNHDVVSLGNCIVNSYSVNFAVGEIPRVDIEGEAQNIQIQANSSGLYNPALNADGGRADTGQYRLDAPSTGDMGVLVLRPEDVTLSFDRKKWSWGGTDMSDMHVQSASIEVPMSRTNISALGAERAVARPLDFPINVTMSVSALLKNFSTGALDMVLTGTAGDDTTDVTITVKDDLGATQHAYRLENASLDSQAFSVGLDDNETVDLTFSAQIGGPTVTGQGLFYTGDCSTGPAGGAPSDNFVGTPNGNLYYKGDNSKAPY